MGVNSVKVRIKNEIMASDLYIRIDSDECAKQDLRKDINNSISKIRKFTDKFSRFRTDNELANFNKKSGTMTVSKELYEMLSMAKQYYIKTNYIFNPAIYQNLLQEGYVKSRTEGYIDLSYSPSRKKKDINPNIFEELLLHSGNTVYKPENLTIDLGGIGKGYIVQKIAEDMRKKHSNFIINIGGDIYASGRDMISDKDFWDIRIEALTHECNNLDLIRVKDRGIATSDKNTRKWVYKGKERNQMIDPRTGRSVRNDIKSVTVVSDTTISADIYAKVILILGLEAGCDYAEERGIATYLVCIDSSCHISPEMKKYFPVD